MVIILERVQVLVAHMEVLVGVHLASSQSMEITCTRSCLGLEVEDVVS